MIGYDAMCVAFDTLHEQHNGSFFKCLKVSVIHAFAKAHSSARSVNPYDGNDDQIDIIYIHVAGPRLENSVSVPRQRQTVFYHFETFFHYKRNKYLVFFAVALHQRRQVRFERHRQIEEDRSRPFGAYDPIDPHRHLRVGDAVVATGAPAQSLKACPAKLGFVQNISPALL